MSPPAASSAQRVPLPDAAEDGWDVSPRLRRRIMTDKPPMREPMDLEGPMPTGRSVLTQAEIEMLLRPDLSDMDEPEEIEVAPLQKQPQPRQTPELTMPVPTDGREETARRIAARLSRAMREHCGLPAAFTVRRVSPTSLAKAVSDREEQGQAIVCCAGADGDVAAMLVLGAGLTQIMIETACGGPVPNGAPKALSPIDLALIEGLTRPLAPFIGTGLGFSGVETDPLFAASIAAPGAAYEIMLSVRAGGAEWPAKLILTEALLPLASPGQAPAGKPASAAGALTVLMTARVARVEMPLSKLTSLRPGATLLLGVPADQPVELLSGGLDGGVAAEGEIGRKGNRMAVRVSRRGPALRALNPAYAE
ncbi:FliM/FliN family flagellar motor switch protein [Hyphomonas sp. WL0036]|uniref:FliM/FliN family flagellar motor C-terminal domain-containing protein n=1 Tax=Hyphomonas sediminis TaxID=2866160 RepID=UPI001C7FAD62|nr:flagellar motor switch protein FliM [Hyphomonas sediminis]MBY9065519.1 FliM/FliN family flagellar motor switch protein [Hyphomonas sediminis]